MSEQNTAYGVAVGLVNKKGEIYLSRRIDTLHFSKKWQFANGRMRHDEDSKVAAARITKDETGLSLPRNRFKFIQSINIDETNEFYYVFLAMVDDAEIPSIENKTNRSGWRSFTLAHAHALDSVPGLRPVIFSSAKARRRVNLEVGKDENPS